MIENAEIELRGLALGAANNIGPLSRKADALEDGAKTCDSSVDRVFRLGRKLVAIVPQGALQNRPLIGDFAADESAHDFVWPFGGAVLLAAQQHIAAHRAFDAGLKSPHAIEQHDDHAMTRARLHERRRQEDRAEGHE